MNDDYTGEMLCALASIYTINENFIRISPQQQGGLPNDSQNKNDE